MRPDSSFLARVLFLGSTILATFGLVACSDGDGGSGAGFGGAAGTGNPATGGPGNGSAGNEAAGGSGNGSAGNEAAGGSGSGTAGEGEPAAVAGVTERHNYVRANVSPQASPALPPLTWSAEIAASAQAYADKCKFEHSKGAYGENLYAGTAVVTGASVVDSWAGEAADFSYDTNKCASGKACGHYTQVVWRDSQRVGCAVTTCTVNSPFGKTNGGEWQNWVCQYDPPGNYVGEKPY